LKENKMKLLSHIARGLPQTENIASDALAFILSKSQTARRAVIHFVSSVVAGLPDDLSFRGQSRDENDTVPDISGADENGQERLLIEAKFWAGLTDNQPTEYLNRFTAKGDCLLLFLGPEARQTTLWQELLRRCEGTWPDISRVDVPGSYLMCVRISKQRVMAIASWRRLIAFVCGELEKTGEHETRDDLAQLRDLCDQMDAHAFRPLRGEDLAPQIGQVVAQYCDLVDEATEAIVHGKIAEKSMVSVNKGVAKKSQLKTKWVKGTYGQYLSIKGCGCCLSFDSGLWARMGETPLWLSVKDESWKPNNAIKKALGPLLNATPRLAVEFYGAIWIPLFLALKAEKQEVVAGIVKQIHRVAELLPDRSKT
jgi:hypothetical protein